MQENFVIAFLVPHTELWGNLSATVSINSVKAVRNTESLQGKTKFMTNHASGRKISSHPADGDSSAEMSSALGLPDGPAAAIAAGMANYTQSGELSSKALAPAASVPSGGQIVFIDGNVPDAQLLAAGVAPGVQAVILDPSQDGVQQIAAYLGSHGNQNLAAIDIVAHGADGLIALGNTVLDSASIGQHSAALSAIGAALQPGGAIQIYGCDVAQDAAGTTFLQQLSAATGGASIAASSHLVGAAADGGNWSLNVDVGTVTAAAPFTAAALSAYPDVLSATDNQIVFVSSNDLTNSADIANRIEQLGVSGTSLVAGSPQDLGDGSQAGYSSLNTTPGGIAVDTVLNRYYVTINDPTTSALTIQEGSLSGTGGLTTIYTDPLQYTLGGTTTGPTSATLGGVALDAQNQQLYYAQATEDYNTGATIASSTGIYRISINGGTPTLITSTTAGIQNPVYVALDSKDNLLFFTDAILPAGGFGATNNLDAVNLSTGSVTVLKSFTSTDQNFILGGLAVDGVNNKIYLTSGDHSDLTSSSNAIYSIPFAVSGSGSSAQPSIGAVTTLYSGSGAYSPFDIRVDPTTGVLYTGGSLPSSNPDYYGAIFAGSVNGGSSLTAVESLATLTNTTAATDAAPEQLVLLSQPIVAAGGTVTAIVGQGAIVADPGLTVSVTDGQLIANASVSGILAGDTLSYNGGATKVFTDGDSIASAFSGGTLTLSGNATAADYQTALDAVTFVSTSSDTAARTLNWTLNNGVVTSATSVSTIDVHAMPTVTAGATATFTGGGSPVTLDSGLTVNAPSSSTLASAAVTIGGYVNGDTLTVGTPGGLSASFANGTLTLSGSASVATYQTALDSITYGFNPANGDPTAGGGNTSRTISWVANDGATSSAAASSTLDTIHVNPTVTAGASATYPENATAITLDPTLSVTDPDSGGNLTGATVSITSGFLSGDTLSFTSQNGITGSYNGATGVLTLTGTASIATYQTALQSVGYSFAGDPTNGGVDNGRSVSWAVTDGAGTSTPVTSSLTTLCFCPGTLIMTPRGEVPVEHLSTGDEVLTASGARRPITWVGQGRVLATRGRRSAATPVIVRKNALGPNVPSRDLRVTRSHALFLDDVLVPVEFLINHRSILWDDHAQEVRLYHIELASHDVLLANGAPAESYRDDGNRWLFGNANAGWGLAPQAPCAPVLTGGAVVDAIWQRLLERAGPLPQAPLTDDPDLHLLVQGQCLDPITRHDDMYVFRLPASPGPIRLCSRAAAPQELGTNRDPRMLGVAVQRMVLAQGGRQRTIAADAASLDDGYHAFEPETGIRWTTGDAAVPPALFAGINSPWMLMLYLGGRTQYRDDGLSIRVA